ncbi:MAG: hypothetical protein K2L87_05245, partial [Clostridiales bacterium]|nr:hypothetical protein [Clostridiales bacterium]
MTRRAAGDKVILCGSGNFYKNDGENVKALKILIDNIKDEERLFSDDYKIFSSYYNIISLCIDLKHINQATEYFEKIKNLINHNYDYFKQSPQYYLFVLLECSLLEANGQYGQAISKLENIYHDIDDHDGIDDIKSLLFDMLGGAYLYIGNPQQALYYKRLGLETCKRSSGSKSYHYAGSLINISETYII